MAIYYPDIIQENIIIKSISDLNSFIQEAALNKYELDKITIIAYTNDQLQQNLSFDQIRLNGHNSSTTQYPAVDSYQNVAVINKLKVREFRFDGLSSITYKVLPNSEVKFIFYLKNPNKGYEKESLASQLCNELKPNIDQEIFVGQMREPEERDEKEKTVPELLIEINNKSDTMVECDLICEYEIQAVNRMLKEQEAKEAPKDPECDTICEYEIQSVNRMLNQNKLDMDPKNQLSMDKSKLVGDATKTPQQNKVVNSQKSDTPCCKTNYGGIVLGVLIGIGVGMMIYHAVKGKPKS